MAGRGTASADDAPWLSLRAWIAVAAIAMLVVVVPGLRSVPAEVLSKPTGYTEIVNGLINGNFLRVSLADAASEADRAVETTPLANANVRSFISQSFLGNDMASLDSRVWHLDPSGLELKAIDINTHLAPNALGPDEPWAGNILFDGASVRPTLAIIDGSGRVMTTIDNFATEQGFIDLGAVGQGAALPAKVRVLRLQIGGNTVASLVSVGDQLALRWGLSQQNLVIKVSGQVIKPPVNHDPIWKSVTAGDQISVSLEGRRAQVFDVRRNTPIVSLYRRGGDRDNEPGMASLANPLAATMPSDAGQVEITIRADLQRAAQQRLSADGRNIVQARGASFRAAAIIMDGLTGDIVALPTFPAATRDLPPAQRQSIPHLRLLERNSNFVAMPIGSTAKIPFSVAILETHPQLAGLRINGAETYRNLLGIDLGADHSDHVIGDIGFRRFIAQSSNKYAATLMLLAQVDPAQLRRCGRPLAQALRFSIVDADTRREMEFPCRPPMSFLAGALAGDGEHGVVPRNLGEEQGEFWTHKFHNLFCVDVDETAGCGSLLWSALPHQHRAISSTILPDRERFGFKVVNSIYDDYVSTILGGNRSRWSLVSLAQTYARIASNRRIQARLVRDKNVRSESARLGLSRLTNLTIRNGMHDAVIGGTADGCCGVLLRTPGLSVFAKTGTPDIASNAPPDPGRRALQRMARQGCGLRLIDNKLGIGTSVRERQVRDRLRELTNACRPFVAMAGQISRAIAALNCEGKPANTCDPGALFNVIRFGADRTSVIDVLAPMQQVADRGHAMVLVTARSGPSGRVCQSSVVAVNFQTRVKDHATMGRPGQSYIRRLIEQPDVLRWLTRPCPAVAR